MLTPLGIIPGAQILLIIGPSMQAGGVVLQVVAEICLRCRSIYDRISQAVHVAFCRDNFCSRCYGGIRDYVTNQGYYMPPYYMRY